MKYYVAYLSKGEVGVSPTQLLGALLTTTGWQWTSKDVTSPQSALLPARLGLELSLGILPT